jgi:hypothetical protein
MAVRSALRLGRPLILIFLICIVGGGDQTGSTRHVGHLLAYCTCPGDCENGEFGGMNGRGNRSTRRKPAPTPLCPPQISLDQHRDWTRAAAVGSQRLTASAMVRPWGRPPLTPRNIPGTHLCYRMSRPPRIRSIEKSNDLIGNRTRDLPAGSIVPLMKILRLTREGER